MRRWGVLAVGLVIITTALFSVTPAEAAGRWKLRLQAAWSSPQGDYREVDGDEVITADYIDSFGLGLQVERMVSKRVGIELGVLWSEPDVNVVIAEPPVRLEIEAPFRITPVNPGSQLPSGVWWEDGFLLRAGRGLCLLRRYRAERSRLRTGKN